MPCCLCSLTSCVFAEICSFNMCSWLQSCIKRQSEERHLKMYFFFISFVTQNTVAVTTPYIKLKLFCITEQKKRKEEEKRKCYLTSQTNFSHNAWLYRARQSLCATHWCEKQRERDSASGSRVGCFSTIPLLAQAACGYLHSRQQVSCSLHSWSSSPSRQPGGSGSQCFHRSAVESFTYSFNKNKKEK